MKKILITGANSYIGTSFEKYMKSFAEKYQVDTIDMRNDEWTKKCFSGYDVVFHVAGIAHSDIGKATSEMKNNYYKINTELAIKTACKAKQDGVNQFIFMSSIIVYGDSAPIGQKKLITKDTPVHPHNFYGDSKLKAENGIRKLEDISFKVVILRPPMIYGKNSKGNYPIMSKIARKIPIFPDICNQRSMLYVGNLIEFVRLLIENEERGIYFPQNEEYSNTSALVKEIAQVHGKKVFLIKGFEKILKLISRKIKFVNKVFGNLCYEHSMSLYKEDYQIYNLQESIKMTEL